jgi:hypothetical protein
VTTEDDVNAGLPAEIERLAEQHRSGNGGWCAPSADQDHHDPLGHLRDKLGLPALAGVVKYGDGDADDLELADGGTVALGNARQLEDLKHLRAAVRGVTGVVIPRLKADAHDAVLGAIEAVADHRDVALRDSEETRGWIADHVASDHGHLADVLPLGDRDQLADALHGESKSFAADDGRLYLRLQPLLQRVTRLYGARIRGRELSTRLGRLGFEREQLSVRVPGEPTPRKGRYWVSPPGFDAGE